MLWTSSSGALVRAITSEDQIFCSECSSCNTRRTLKEEAFLLAA